MKNTFIQNEIWTLTFGAAFQRANIYESNAPEIEKVYFKQKMRGTVENVIFHDYQKPVEDNRHIENIFRLSEFSKNFAPILRNGQINFGVSQKILNLYLKYQWCLGFIPEPPHFPVDRRIQEILRLSPVLSWTQMKDEKDYIRIVNQVRDKVNENESIAAYELMTFSRRNSY